MNLLLLIVMLGIIEPQTNYQKTETFFVESTKNIENEEFYLKAKFFDEEKTKKQLSEVSQRQKKTIIIY